MSNAKNHVKVVIQGNTMQTKQVWQILVTKKIL